MKYLKKLLTHKWYVFVASCRLGIPLLGVIHDLSKFTPIEYIPYSRYPFGSNNIPDDIQSDFDNAWNNHQKRNKHHWQYWVLINDEDGTYPLPIPRRYVLEMVADWMGASKAYTGSWCMVHWMNKTMVSYLDHMHQETINILYDILEEHGYLDTGFDGWYCLNHDLHI